MALSKGAKVALALVGTATVVGGVVYVANQSKPKPKKNKKPKPDADVGIDDGEEQTEPTVTGSGSSLSTTTCRLICDSCRLSSNLASCWSDKAQICTRAYILL